MCKSLAQAGIFAYTILKNRLKAEEGSTMDRVDKENYYLDIAQSVLERSTCLRR